MDFNKVEDSGERREFSTGSVRDRQNGKGRFDLITPIALRRLAKHYEHGASKYGDSNWMRGQPVKSSYFDSALRHMNRYLELKIKGEKPTEDHLAAAAWNIFAIIHTEEMIELGLLPKELLDWPEPLNKIKEQ